MSNQQKQIGEIIKEIRENLSFSRSELAKAAGLTTDTIWKIETGRSSGRVDTLEAIASALGVSVPEIYERAGMNRVAEGYETDPLVTRLKIALGRVPQGERGRVVAIWENICEVIGTLTTE